MEENFFIQKFHGSTNCHFGGFFLYVSLLIELLTLFSFLLNIDGFRGMWGFKY
jgi:hypothetical protein